MVAFAAAWVHAATTRRATRNGRLPSRWRVVWAGLSRVALSLKLLVAKMRAFQARVDGGFMSTRLENNRGLAGVSSRAQPFVVVQTHT
jgi:hypothetical protein